MIRSGPLARTTPDTEFKLVYSFGRHKEVRLIGGVPGSVRLRERLYLGDKTSFEF